ncbi:MAG: hypothetical protein KDA75_17455 [Planctomycetaceae bacterium]|nr:hypothetical protein [Planctomycetaceae bacterium]
MSRQSRTGRTAIWIRHGLLAGLAITWGSSIGYGQIRQRVSNTTPNGDALGSQSSQFADVGQGTGEESILVLNGDYARLINPGDSGLLQIFDQDLFQGGGASPEYYRFTNNNFNFTLRTSDTADRRIENNNDSDLEIRTDGEFFNIYTDTDNDTTQTDVGRWFNNGTGLSNRIFQIDISGNVEIDGSLTENFAFDLAEAFLKTETIEAGQLIAVDDSRFDGVRLTKGVGDRAVIGVASTRPGVILGGGAFGVDQIEANWGAAHVERFRAQQSDLQSRALAASETLPEHQSRIESLAKFSVGRFGFEVDESMVVEDGTPIDPERPLTIKRNDWEELQAAYAEEQASFADELEGAAIDLFLKETLVPVALAGRVPVQVDGSFGHIMAGDYLAPSPIPGVAMKATHAGPTVGVALESFDGERGMVKMLVQRGWYGGEAADPSTPRALDQLASVTTDAVQPAADQTQMIRDLQQQNAELLQRLVALEQRFEGSVVNGVPACQ